MKDNIFVIQTADIEKNPDMKPLDDQFKNITTSKGCEYLHIPSWAGYNSETSKIIEKCVLNLVKKDFNRMKPNISLFKLASKYNFPSLDQIFENANSYTDMHSINITLLKRKCGFANLPPSFQKRIVMNWYKHCEPLFDKKFATICMWEKSVDFPKGYPFYTPRVKCDRENGGIIFEYLVRRESYLDIQFQAAQRIVFFDNRDPIARPISESLVVRTRTHKLRIVQLWFKDAFQNMNHPGTCGCAVAGK